MHRWKLSALAAATVLTAALSPTDAAALSMGTLTVQSALGEPLRAEISVTEATAADISSLSAQIAPPEAFSAQGMDYSATASAITVQVQRHANGTATLRLSSNNPVNEPFVDLVVQTQWAAGQLARSYTLLLDAPKPQSPSQTPTPAPAAVIAPQVSAAPASVTGRSYGSRTAKKRVATTIPTAAASTAAASKPASSSDTTVRVRSGDTAGRIANAHRPRGVSLDQMLVAMLRSNPNAFVNGNVNRLRAGAVLQMPNRDQALATSATEARQIVAAQSRDFNAYRRSLASKAPKATVASATRSASGQVQAHVAEARPAAEAPDKLTLSKGSVQNAAEAELAAQKQTQDQDSRLSELQRNLAELNELAQNSPAPAPEPAAATATAAAATAAANQATPESQTDTAASNPAPTVEVTQPTLAAATATAEAAATTDTTPAPAPDAAASDTSAATTSEAQATAEQAAPDAPVAAPEASSASSAATTATPNNNASTNTDSSNLWLPVGGGLLALVLGLVGYTAWKRRRDADSQNTEDHTDASDNNAATQSDPTFAGEASASQDPLSASNTAPTLGAIQEPDPIAEADMYLAYGRDLQAEELLKEALHHNPEHLACYGKLAEIYSKRQDTAALEKLARDMQAAVPHERGQWQSIVEMGRRLDATHPYFAATAPDAARSAATGANAVLATSAFAAALDSAKLDRTAAAAENTEAGDSSAAAPAVPEFDWNLDLNLPQTQAADNAAAGSVTASEKQADSVVPNLDLPKTSPEPELQSGAAHATPAAEAAIPQPATAATEPNNTPEPDFGSLDLDVPDLAQAQPSSTPAATPSTPAAAPVDAGFDLGSLDLDLGTSPAPATESQPVHNLADDPLSTKLDLAQEFNAIGDSEGARALIEEVLAEASGTLKERAQHMLSELD